MSDIGKVRFVFAAIVVITLISIELFSQYSPIAWSPETQITSSSGDSRIVDISVGPSGPLALVWEDNRDGSNQVYYKSSNDNGLTWGPDTRLSNIGPHTSDPLPRVATNGNQLLVLFSGATGSGEHLFYTTSTDYGTTFTTQNQLTNDPGYQTNAALSIDGATVQVTWQNYLEGAEHIYYTQSADGGKTWLPEMALTAASGQDRHPAMVGVGMNVFVVWSRYDQGQEALFFRASHDGGASWQPEVQLSEYGPSSFSIFPSIGTNGTRVDVVWNAGGVLYARSADGGLDWDSPRLLTNQTRQYLAPRISTSGSQLRVVSAAISIKGNQAATISSDIYYLESPDGGDVWSDPLSLTAHSEGQQSLAPAIAVRGRDTFVAWEDNRNGHLAIFLRSRPDFVEQKAFVTQLTNVALIAITAIGVSYLLLELIYRSRGRARKRRARRRKKSTKRRARRKRRIR